MTEPKQQWIEGLEKGDPRAARPKARRVSQRKELAVVTLGMVAAISGVSGLLAASPPSGIGVETASAGNETAIVQPEPSPGDGEAYEAADSRSAGSGSGTPGGVEPLRSDGPSDRAEPTTEASAQPAPQAVQKEPAQTPSWSASSPQEAPARSRGS
ncbi:MAG: hypothetical protein M3272_05785 [Actinomycetota bacterium]|nr:hypothetical protein [Actinomycetota bacterium]